MAAAAPRIEAHDSPLIALMGADWHSLKPAVRARFGHEPETGHPVVYRGVMEKVHCSLAGWLFAQVTRLIGNPLAAHRGTDVPMEVRLTPCEKGGVCWQRTYGFKTPFIVTSAKRQDAQGRLCEYVGLGFGMRLEVYARDGALHFESRRYFWEVMGVQVPLPDALTPGRTHVIHEDISGDATGGGRFRFTISMDHMWFGRTFFQTGVFERV